MNFLTHIKLAGLAFAFVTLTGKALENASKRYEDLSSRLDEALAVIASKDEELKNSKEQNEAKEQKIQRLEHEHEKEHSAVNDGVIAKQEKLLEEQSEDHSHTIQKLNNTHEASLTRQKAEFEVEREKSAVEYTELNKRFDDVWKEWEEEASYLKKQLRTQESKLDISCAEVDTLKEQTKEAEGRAKKVEVKLKDEVAGLRKSLQDQNTKHVVETDQLKQSLVTKQSELKSIQSEFEIYQADMKATWKITEESTADLGTEVSSIRQALQDRDENIIVPLREECKRLQQELSAAQAFKPEAAVPEPSVEKSPTEQDAVDSRPSVRLPPSVNRPNLSITPPREESEGSDVASHVVKKGRGFATSGNGQGVLHSDALVAQTSGRRGGGNFRGRVMRRGRE